MTEYMIEKGIMIDDVESVLRSIREMSSKYISDITVVKKFITHEKNTRFYVDSNLNSYMQPEDNCIYVWLDTGYVDYYGNPILISLIKSYNGFVGHVVGTLMQLCNSAKQFFKLSKNLVGKKVETIKKKYETKSSERTTKHIVEEKQYLLGLCNDEQSISEFARKFQMMDLDLEEDFIEEDDELIVEESEENERFEKYEKFSEVQEQITVELLLEKMEEMENYIEKLLNVIEAESTKNKQQIQELQKENDEIKRAIVQMRDFTYQEAQTKENEEDTATAHSLLGRHRKILVVGSELGTNIMQGIAKVYGFEKNDFDFMDYDKAKGNMDRIQKEGRYYAVIFGSCPHKTAASAGYSSFIEKAKQSENMPYIVEARTKSGKLKMTKEAFKRALGEVCESMREMCVA